MRRLLDILFLIRPPLLLASCTFFFAGAIAAISPGKGLYRFDSMQKILPNLVLYGLIVSAVFVVNQILDARSDAINRKSYILPQRLVSRLESVVFLFTISAAAFTLSFYRDGLVRTLAVTGLILGFAYSVPPLRLKGRPVIDVLANVIGFGLIGFLMGWQAIADVGAEAVLRALPYMLAMGGIFLNTCIPDEKGDRVVGDRTSCVRFGGRPVSLAGLILLLCSGFAGAALHDTLCATAVLISLPGFVVIAVDPTPRNSVVGSQFAARVLFVLVSLKAPLLAVLGLVAYGASRSYYSRRLGLEYPRLEGARSRDISCS
jgi:4-hydroxybenzoate polyprenyltransferase